MESKIRKVVAKDNELISWQSIHQTEEQKAAKICVDSKTKLIPAFVQLLRFLRNPINLQDNRKSNPNSDHQTGAINQTNQRLHDQLDPEATENKWSTPWTNHNDTDDLDPFTKLGQTASKWCVSPFEVHTSGQPEANRSQMCKHCNALQAICKQLDQEFQNVMLFGDLRPLRGVLPSRFFGQTRWTRLFLECEYSASRLLYALICYLEQNATISENVHVVEYKEADFFFMRNVNDIISDNFERIQHALLVEQLDQQQECASFPVNLVLKVVNPLIAQVNKHCHKFISGANSFKTPLLNTLLELLFQLVQSTSNQNGEQINDQLFDTLIGHNRCNHVLSGARMLAVDFCTRSMHALTGTLFHFWLSKLPLTQAHMNELNDYAHVFECITDHVHAACHKIILLTGETTRPYGFIMRATLEDSLPARGWPRELVIDIRLCLQECLSLYMNWRFEFSTIYPPPVQAQNTRLAQLSIFFQSMLESLIDFHVILVIASQLISQMQANIQTGKSTFDQLHIPTTLLHALECNFASKCLHFEHSEGELQDKPEVRRQLVMGSRESEPTVLHCDSL